MKQDIVTTFETVTMSDDCAQKIRRAMAEKKSAPRAVMAKRLGTLAAALALILCLSPTARAAVETIVEKYFFPDSGVTIEKEVNENGEISAMTVSLDTESGTVAEIRGGRLYFTGNGEDIDITDLIAPEKPYYYSYTDEYGFLHHIAVGYSGSIENFGVYEFFLENQGTWSNGYGRNFLDPETGTRYPWVDLVWEHFNIPWPLPE